MSAPVIRAIAIDPPVVAPGGSATITIDAFDPDDGNAVISIVVTDGSGNSASGSATIAIKDPLDFAITTDRGFISGTSQNNVFVWTDG